MPPQGDEDVRGCGVRQWEAAPGRVRGCAEEGVVVLVPSGDIGSLQTCEDSREVVVELRGGGCRRGTGAAGRRQGSGSRQLEVCRRGGCCRCSYCVLVVRFETVGDGCQDGRRLDDLLDAVLQPGCHEEEAVVQRQCALVLHRSKGGPQGGGKPARGAAVGVVNGPLGELWNPRDGSADAVELMFNGEVFVQLGESPEGGRPGGAACEELAQDRP